MVAIKMPRRPIDFGFKTSSLDEQHSPNLL